VGVRKLREHYYSRKKYVLPILAKCRILVVPFIFIFIRNSVIFYSITIIVIRRNRHLLYLYSVVRMIFSSYNCIFINKQPVVMIEINLSY
jgi:hypothetical protein